MEDHFTKIEQLLKLTNRKRIVFPEIMDERVIRAANRLAEENVITPIYIGCKNKLIEYASLFQVELVNYECIDPKIYEEKEMLIEKLIERRNGRLTKQQAIDLLEKSVYFGTMLVYVGKADGMISGATYTTSDAVLPALQIIKTEKGVKKTSGAYFMLRGDEKYIFADCAININPSSEDLAEIALQSAKTAKIFQMEPRVALLSFSTMGSATSIETEKIVNAKELTKKLNPNLLIDGELQFDAAYLPQVAKKKAPRSEIKGNANVFVFPNLEAGNISCKIVERLGGFTAVGPILQGLSKPVNLLSRGCSEADIYKVALITAMQANKIVQHS